MIDTLPLPYRSGSQLEHFGAIGRSGRSVRTFWHLFDYLRVPRGESMPGDVAKWGWSWLTAPLVLALLSYGSCKTVWSMSWSSIRATFSGPLLSANGWCWRHVCKWPQQPIGTHRNRNPQEPWGSVWLLVYLGVSCRNSMAADDSMHEAGTSDIIRHWNSMWWSFASGCNMLQLC